MAEKIAIGVGKKLVGKKLNEKLNDVLGDRNKAPSDAYRFYDTEDLDRKGEPKKRKKDEAYFHHIIGLPYDRNHPPKQKNKNKDALLAYKIFSRAKKLDGKRIGPFRFGLTSIIAECLPVGGAVVDYGLAMLLIVVASKDVSGGMDKMIYAKMTANAGIDFALGLMPIFGALGDGLYKANTRNALLFEKFIVARFEANEEAMKEEKTGRASSRNRAQTDRYPNPEPAPRLRHHAQTDGYYEPEPTPPRRGHTLVNEYHDSGPTPALPPRSIDERHGGVHERLGRTVASPARTALPSRSGGSWFSGRKKRKGAAVAQGANGTRGREMAQVKDSVPARPLRPDTAG